MFPSAGVRRWLFVVLLPMLLAPLALLDARQSANGKKYALIVGVRAYDSAKLDTLKYTENDAEGLAEVLQKAGGFSVRVLTTSRGEKRKADAPTTANLRAEISRLLADKTRSDTILVALSGHGVQGKVAEGNQEKDESFFCPANAQLNDNATLIAVGKLFADLDHCGAGVKLLLVDACRNEPGSSRNVDIDTLPRLPRGTAALFSCKSGERAFETPKLGKGHGVFFHHVLQGLKGEAKNRQGEVTWGGLAEYVTGKVSDDVPVLIGGGAKQTPELKVNLTGKSPVLVRLNNVVVNSIGMRLVRIPPGKFTMGSPQDEKDRKDDEQQHEVDITKEFWLGVYEVTQEQFKEVMGYNPSFFCPGGEPKSGFTYLPHHRPAGGKEKVVGKETSTFPVENVSWDEATEFCAKLTRRTQEKRAGSRYRLPSEAEWEYACRGGAEPAKAFHCGGSISSTQANIDGRSSDGGADKGGFLERTRKVGSYKPNRFGLFDMHGNVMEWCADRYGKDYYATSPPRDPPGPSEGSNRVIRGGSWGSKAPFCRSAFRNRGKPEAHSNRMGFRVVLVPSDG